MLRICSRSKNSGGKDIPPNAFPSNSEELNFLQEVADEFPKLLSWVEKNQPEQFKKGREARLQEAKTRNEKLKAYIQQERKKRGFSTPKNSNNKTNSSQPSQNTQQVQNLQNEINSLNQKLNEITNLVQELLAKQNQNKPITETEKKEIEIKLSGLQEQKEQVQTQLNQKQTQKEELTKQPENSQQPANKEFNWWYVVIPLGGLLLIAGIIIVYLMGKKSKKE